MSNFSERVMRLKPHELRVVLVLGFLLFVNSMARQVSGIVAVSGFLNTSSVNSMLLVMGIDYVFVLLVGGLQSLIVDRYNRIRLMAGVSLAFALVFIILRVMFAVGSPGWLNYSVMYLIAEQQLVLFPVIFWVLANDIFSFSQAQRVFPLVASWSFIGKLIGIGIAWISPYLFEWLKIKPEEILLFNAFVYLVGFLLVISTLRKVSIRHTVQQSETFKENLTEGWDFVKGIDSFRFLMFAIIALAVADTIIEFRFLVVTDALFIGLDAYQRFYSLYRLGATVLGFVVQVFITSRLMNRMHVKRVFLIFPLVILIGAGGVLVSPGLWAAVAAMLTVKLVRETVDDSARKSIQALVPEERRGRVSTFIDNYLPATGTILACLITGGIVVLGEKIGRDLHLAYLAIALLSGAFALWAVIRMGRVYEKSLLNWRLKRRQRSSDTLIDKISNL